MTSRITKRIATHFHFTYHSKSFIVIPLIFKENKGKGKMFDDCQHKVNVIEILRSLWMTRKSV